MRRNTNWLATVALAAVATVVAGMGEKAAYYAIFTRADDGIDPELTAGLYATATGFFTLFGIFGGLFAFAASLASVRTGALQPWLGWAGVAVGLVGIATSAKSQLAQLAFPLFVLWLLTVSVALLRRA